MNDFLHINSELKENDIIVKNIVLPSSKYAFYKIKSFTRSGAPRVVLLRCNVKKVTWSTPSSHKEIIEPDEEDELDDKPQCLTKREGKYWTLKGKYFSKYDPNQEYLSESYW